MRSLPTSMPSRCQSVRLQRGGDRRAAIESVLAQTWQAFTLTLIDDGRPTALPTFWRYRRAIGASGSTHRWQRGAIANSSGIWFGNADYVMPNPATT